VFRENLIPFYQETRLSMREVSCLIRRPLERGAKE
jgi:hypothetical protein